MLKDLKSKAKGISDLKSSLNTALEGSETYNDLVSPELSDAADVGLFASLERNVGYSLENNTEMQYDKQMDLSAVRTMLA